MVEPLEENKWRELLDTHPNRIKEDEFSKEKYILMLQKGKILRYGKIVATNSDTNNNGSVVQISNGVQILVRQDDTICYYVERKRCKEAN